MKTRVFDGYMHGRMVVQVRKLVEADHLPSLKRDWTSREVRDELIAQGMDASVRVFRRDAKLPSIGTFAIYDDWNIGEARC